MKILYVHGFGSYYDPAKSKVQTLQSLGDVVGVNVDYCEGFEVSVQKVKDAAMSCDLIVGTSMGGFMASHVGAAFGIPFVALNPAINPSESLKKYVGAFVDYGGNHKVLDEAVVAHYPAIKTVGGCGLVLLEADDDVIDPNETLAALDDVYDVRMIEGGSHRFDSLPAQLSEIQDFFDGAGMVYGL